MDPSQVNIKLRGEKKQDIDAMVASMDGETPQDIADLFNEFAMGKSDGSTPGV